MKQPTLYLWLLLVYFSGTMASAQQPTLEWATGFSSRGSQIDHAIAVAVDAEGNSYVTGTSANAFTSSITTIKYSPSGDTIWVKTYKGMGDSEASAIAVDSQGGVYVTGTSGSDYLTVGYNATDGKEKWAMSYNGAGNGQDYARAIAVDNQGGVYVTGTSAGIETNTDYATLRYESSDGEEKWAMTYNGTGNDYDVASAIAVDSQGGVYVTGTSGSDYLTVGYNASDGKVKWAESYNSTENGYDVATAIAVDNQGGVYVTGYSESLTDDIEYLTIRHNASDGKVQWAKTYNGAGYYYNYARAIAVDSQGGVYVTGYSESSETNTDYATLRYESSDGEEKWVMTYNSTGNGYDSPNAIAVDNQGGVYVTGFSKGDYATIRYEAKDGEEKWAETYNGAGNSDDLAKAIALDSQGNVIVTGYSYSSQTSYDFLTLKYSQGGECPALAQAPVKGYTTVSAGRPNTRYTLSAPGAASFDWQITDAGGSSLTAFSGQGTSTVSVDWPGEPEVYQVSVSYSNGQGCPGQTSDKLVFAYDTDAGFVSGGGWSESPVNQDYELMRQGGRAYWAFGARYKEDKHQDASAGDPVQGTLLLLLEGGRAFRATSVQEGSLVIAGERAYFTGTGTLTRRGGSEGDERRLAFLLSAVDGQLERPREKDRLRLVIWEVGEDGSKGDILYDNQLSCGNPELDLNAEACPEIGRGSIVIHRKGLKADKGHKVLAEQGSQQLEAYPTAFSHQAILSFTLERDADYTLELYDLKGALVRQIATGTARAGKRTEHWLEAQGLREGLYLVRLATSEGTQTAKVIVQR